MSAFHLSGSLASYANGLLSDMAAAQRAAACPHTIRAIRRANEIDARAKRTAYLLCLTMDGQEIGRLYPSDDPNTGGLWRGIADAFAHWAGVEPEQVEERETKDGDRIVIAGEIVGRTQWGRA